MWLKNVSKKNIIIFSLQVFLGVKVISIETKQELGKKRIKFLRVSAVRSTEKSLKHAVRSFSR